MSILDTFTILFNSNDKAAKEGLDAVDASGKKLENTLNATGEAGVKSAHEIAEGNSRLAESFDVVKEHAGEMASRLIEHALEVAAAFQALFAVEKLVDNFFETAEQSDQLGERAKSIGVETETLDAWGNAAKRVGGSAQAFGDSIMNVNRQLTRMEATGKSRILPFFKELGVSMADSHGHARKLFDLLPELAKATEGKDKQTTSGALRGIGFDEGTIRLLQRGGKELDELLERQKKLGLVTAEDAETAEKFNIEWDDVKQLFHSVTVELDTYLLPILEDLLSAVEIFVEFLRDHKNLVIGFFMGVAAAAIYATNAFRLFGVILAFITSPVTLLVAAVLAIGAAFAFAYDDLLAFRDGSNSVIGELAKRWPIIGDVARGILAVFSELREKGGEFLTYLNHKIREIPEGLRQWEEIFSALGGIIANFASSVVSKIEEMFPAMKGVFDDIGAIFHASIPLWADILKASFIVMKESVWAFWQYVKAMFVLFVDLITDPEHAFQHFAATMSKVISDIIGQFPLLQKAFEGVGAVFDNIGRGIIKLWQDIGSIITNVMNELRTDWDTVKTIGAAVGSLPGGAVAAARRHLPTWLGGTPEASPQAAIASPASGHDTLLPHLPAAQDALQAANSPIMSQTSASMAHAAANNNVTNNINVGATTINAQSSDPKAIATAFDQHMNDHVQSAITNLADGTHH